MAEPARGVQVEPQRLEASARVCRELRGGIGRMLDDAEGETEAAANALRGWAFQGALRHLLETRRDDLNRLGSRLEATATALDRSAAAYRRREEANAAWFRTAEQPW